MSFSSAFLEKIKTSVKISDIVSRHVNWDTKKSNLSKQDFWAPCPFHQEKTASFHVDDQKGFYYCFGCHAKGDAISFVKETENVNFIEAVEILAKEAGLQMPEQDPQAKEKSSYRDELFKIMDLSVRFYLRSLSSAKGARAREYINNRKLTSEIIDEFELGFAPNSRTELFDYLSDKNIPEQHIIDTGMCLRPDDGGAVYDRFRDRIMYPIRDSRGRCIAFGGRAMSQNANAKYLNSPETKLFDKGRSLYNFSAARSALRTQPSLIVAEGYMDVIALSQASFKASVAPLGTAITKDQLALIWRISPSPVVALDGDRAGVNAAYRLIDLALPLIETGKTIKFALMPEGYDPDDLIKERGRDAMQNLVDEAISLADLLWRRETEGLSLDNPEARAALDKKLDQALSNIRDRQLKYHYLQHFKDLKWTAFIKRPGKKFSGSQNIVIGGLAGAMPPLLGWTAVVGSIDPLPLLLVLLIFIWTPPHFWALAINKKDEYAKAGIPMMPVVKGIEYTKIQIVLYSILLMVVSLLLFATGYFGYLYLFGASLLGGIFIQKSWKLKKSDGADNSMSLFLYSIVYLTLIFVFMIADRAVITYV